MPIAEPLQEGLTDAVYRAALEPAAWPEVMRLMNARFPSSAQTFYFLDLEPRRVRPICLLGVAPRWVQTFDELYFAGDNPWIRLSERLHRPGVVRTNERLEALIHDAGALYRSARHIAMHGEMQLDVEEPMRVALGAPTNERHVERGHRMTPASQDVDDVHRHAARETEGERLDRRRPRGACAVESHFRGAARGAET